jgi:hypothetical protein
LTFGEPPPPEVIDGIPQCNAERILDERIKGQKKHYLIRWEGYLPNQDSWEPAQYIEQDCPEAVAQFKKILKAYEDNAKGLGEKATSNAPAPRAL